MAFGILGTQAEGAGKFSLPQGRDAATERSAEQSPRLRSMKTLFFQTRHRWSARSGAAIQSERNVPRKDGSPVT